VNGWKLLDGSYWIVNIEWVEIIGEIEVIGYGWMGSLSFDIFQ